MAGAPAGQFRVRVRVAFITPWQIPVLCSLRLARMMVHGRCVLAF